MDRQFYNWGEFMKKILLAITIILMLLSACANNEPAIVKEETVPEPDSEPELVEEEHGDDEQVDEFIEFPLDDEQIIVNLEMVPILSEYLSAVTDRKKEIEKMTIDRVHSKDESIYLLEFSCQNESCSYLLFSQEEEKQAYLLADLAKSTNITVSPDNTKLLFQFNREGSLPLPLSNIVVIDITNWETVSLSNNTNDANILNYSWPLLNADWVDNEIIAVEKPSVIEPTNELIDEWQKTEKPSTTNIIMRTN